jgi:succinate dehydrogenase/fumarate reductase flavoprotein subunit
MIEKDVVVVGSGGGGLCAATVAAGRGLDVLLVEKTAWFGGTTALSGGGIWAPCNSLAAAAGIGDDRDLAAQYVRETVGPTVRTDLVDAFLEAVPRMVDHLQANTAVRFTLQPGFPDWNPKATGFTPGGRLLSPVEFDGRELGDHFAQLRWPLAEFNAPGGFMIGLGDMPHIANIRNSFASFRHVARLLARFAIDRLRYPRGTRLTMGNALAARLLRSALDAGVELWRNAPMRQLLIEDGMVKGIVVERDGGRIEVLARRGVILASGGFSAIAEMRRQYIPFPDQHVSLVPDGNTGDGLQQALAAGGRFDGDNISNAGWVVISLLRQADGTVRKFPHLFLDRGKPGCIAVNDDGRRFGNESTTNLVEPMHRTGSVPAHLICDHRFIRKYGLGYVRPGGIGLKRMLAANYVISAPTITELAIRIGVDAAGLNATVERFNRQAEAGVDDDFQRGADPADHAMGDMRHRPNPCLGVIRRAPFYAVKIYPGDTTTTVGLCVDAQARVLRADGAPIPGLHAIGLDMNSLWRGRAPAHGANNTLGLTFGFIAAEALAAGEPAGTAATAAAAASA